MKKCLFLSLLFSFCLVMSVSCRHSKSNDDAPSVSNDQQSQAKIEDKTAIVTTELAPKPATKEDAKKVAQQLQKQPETKEIGDELSQKPEALTVPNNSLGERYFIIWKKDKEHEYGLEHLDGHYFVDKQSPDLYGPYLKISEVVDLAAKAWAVVQYTNKEYNLVGEEGKDPNIELKPKFKTNFKEMSNFTMIGDDLRSTVQTLDGKYGILGSNLKYTVNLGVYSQIGSFRQDASLGNRVLAYVKKGDREGFIDENLRPTSLVMVHPSKGAFPQVYFVVDTASCTVQETAFAYDECKSQGVSPLNQYLYEVEFSTYGTLGKTIENTNNFTCETYMQKVVKAVSSDYTSISLKTKAGPGVTADVNNACEARI